MTLVEWVVADGLRYDHIKFVGFLVYRVRCLFPAPDDVVVHFEGASLAGINPKGQSEALKTWMATCTLAPRSSTCCAFICREVVECAIRIIEFALSVVVPPPSARLTILFAACTGYVEITGEGSSYALIAARVVLVGNCDTRPACPGAHVAWVLSVAFSGGNSVEGFGPGYSLTGVASFCERESSSGPSPSGFAA